MTKNKILSVDIKHSADIPKNTESKGYPESKCDSRTGDIDELIFPEEYFYISQR